MPSRKIEQQLDQLNTLRSQPATEATARALCKALADRVNLVVAKAAAIAGELQCRELLPDLEIAFERFFQKPVETDPQCWAKNALSKTLKDLEYAESALFLCGLRHVQMEPVYKGHADTAATLRGTCALALAQCRDIPSQEIMQHLVNALADSAASVRVDAVRALEQMDGDAAALLLRLKARMGDPEPEVTGQALDSLLSIERDAGVEFVAGFLRLRDEDTREQAALALGASRLASAVEALKEAWSRSRTVHSSEPLLRALSISRQESGFEFLLQLIRDGREQDALEVLNALRLHRESPEIMKRVRNAAEVRGGPVLNLFRERFESGC
ncbi:MAG TPA: hypothetical protein VLI55_04490 [Bryobacteraceae bacterium]|nr:hypothetical protein [Bryobacteraceae bacterium]